jgi:trehalose 6-phosphate phosphatase
MGSGLGGCGFFFDFDGTLAPIQADPATVQPVAGAVEALTRLAARARLTAVVSARPVDFLQSRLGGVTDLVLYGLYGLETLNQGGSPRTDPAALPWLPVVRQVVERARRELPPSVGVEDKRLSVALHYRSRPELRAEVEHWAAAQASRLGLGAQAGRLVVELRPPVKRGKGEVVEEALPGLSGAWYFGDDVADLEAFAALDRQSAATPEFGAVKVAVYNPETGSQLQSSADVVLSAPEAVPAYVTDLLNGS